MSLPCRCHGGLSGRSNCIGQSIVQTQSLKHAHAYRAACLRAWEHYTRAAKVYGRKSTEISRPFAMQSSIPETAETKRTALDSRSRFRTSEQSSSMDNESDLPHCFALKSKRNPIICNRKQSKARRVQLMSRCPRFVCLFCGECILVLHTEAKPSAVCHSAGLPTESVTVAEVLSTVLPHGR